MSTLTTGRQREVAAIVTHDRAVEVAKLLMGLLNAPMRPIFPEDYQSLPRRNLRSGKQSLRDGRQDELKDFCRDNFGTSDFKRLSALYERLYENSSRLRLPLQEFAEIVGQPPSDVLRGAPRHSTIALSPWGLQTEYPEMHLARDLGLAYNDALDSHQDSKQHDGVSWKRAKGQATRDVLAAALRRGKYSMRMCLLSCFNLVEAYINGVAWEYVQTVGTTGLSKRQEDLLTKGQASLLDKLIKVPAIVKDQDSGPLSKDQDPLAKFRDLVKPYRDSVVHASPFSALERFGGYDKLQRVYELEIATATTAVELTLTIISSIHEFLGAGKGLPFWLPSRDSDGRFIME